MNSSTKKYARNETKVYSKKNNKTIKYDKKTKINGQKTIHTTIITEKTKYKGKTIAKRYEVVGEFKPGNKPGEARNIFLCHDLKKDCNVVIKYYNENVHTNKKVLNKWKSLNHPNIINLFDFKISVKNPYEVMQYAQGGSLQDRLDNNEIFTEIELKKIIIPQILMALKGIHEKAIIHRDLKPSNIFYLNEKRKEILLGDFGISSYRGTDASIIYTKPNRTEDFSAPEVYKEEIGIEVDYYALGITLIFLCTGVSPFADTLTPEKIMYTHINGEVPLPDNISKNFRILLQWLLVKDRKKRWKFEHVNRWLSGEIFEQPVFQSIKPVREYSKEFQANTPLELANFIEHSVKNDNTRFIREFRSGRIQKWVEELGDYDLADKIQVLSDKETFDIAAIVQLIYILDPSRDYNLFDEGKAENLLELADLIESNTEDSIKHLENDWFNSWLSCNNKWKKNLNEKQQETILSKLNQLNNNVDLALFEIIYTFNPTKPYRFKNGLTAGTCSSLANIMDKKWELGKDELFSGKVEIWLSCTGGYKAIYEQWQKIKHEYTNKHDLGLERFLQLCGLKPPKARIVLPDSEYSVTVSPDSDYSVTNKFINAGNVHFETTAIKRFVIEKKGRGYLYGKVRLAHRNKGMSLSTNTFYGDRTEITIKYNPSKLHVRESYEDQIIIQTFGNEQKIKSFFYIDFTYWDSIKKRVSELWRGFIKLNNDNDWQFVSWIIAIFGGIVSFTILLNIHKLLSLSLDGEYVTLKFWLNAM